MSQKPVDKRNCLATREALWKAIRRLKIFTFKEVRYETQCSLSTVTEYLVGLTAAGYLERDSQRVYTLVRDIGVDTPHVRRDGTEYTQGKGREQIWTVLPILKEFSVRDVVVHASTEQVSVAETTVQEYLKYLHKAGYLAMARPSRPGHKPGTGQQVRYRFLMAKYTGPKAPMIQRAIQLFDRNIEKVVWSKGVGHE